jgi:hypothetical protein
MICVLSVVVVGVILPVLYDLLDLGSFSGLTLSILQFMGALVALSLIYLIGMNL